MSGKETRTSGKTDRRVARTRDVLGDAIVELMQELPFEAITIQHVLDRAGVARSTFYTHYRDKDDLFLSEADEFFQRMATSLYRNHEGSNRIAPVHELFSHISEMREFYRALVASGKIHDLLELGRGHFARRMDERLATIPLARHIPPDERATLAHAFAGALFSMLDGWIDRNPRPSPKEMDALFHKLVWSGIAGPTR